ncbi:MAG: hypothetical protein J1F67_05160 [Muribaculaceae bacterium]|nr:hypothetical protein [Muribaculaceae bacterium]
MNDNLRIEDKSLVEIFSRLQNGIRSDLVLKALKKGGEKLQADTKVQLRKKLGKGASSTNHHRRPMLKGITLKEDQQYIEVRVSLYGDFRLKWFELGTKERKLKRTGAKDRERGRTKGDKRYLYRKKGKENFYKAGTNRGRIKALDFFQEAREKDMEKVTGIIKTELTKELQQLLR